MRGDNFCVCTALVCYRFMHNSCSAVRSDKPLLIRLPPDTSLLRCRQVSEGVSTRRDLAVLVVLVHELVVLDVGRKLDTRVTIHVRRDSTENREEARERTHLALAREPRPLGELFLVLDGFAPESRVVTWAAAAERSTSSTPRPFES